MAQVELKSVAKSFGVVDVIEGLDLSIPDGAFTVFVGPSGCGKSTLLRLIAGLENLTGGDIEIGGRNVNKADPIERGVAMVFQNYALYPHMTVEQNISFSLRMARVRKAEIAERVAARGARAAGGGAARSASPPSSPAASASASPSAAPSCATRKCSSSTSRCRTSMRSCASPCASRSPSCTSRSARR